MQRDVASLMETGLSIVHSTIGTEMADLVVADLGELDEGDTRRLVGVMATLVELALASDSLDDLDRAVQLMVDVDQRGE